MTNNFNTQQIEEKQSTKATSLREMFCFALLFVGLMIILIPSSQRKPVLSPVASVTKVAAKHNATVIEKIAMAFHRAPAGSVVR